MDAGSAEWIRCFVQSALRDVRDLQIVIIIESVIVQSQ